MHAHSCAVAYWILKFPRTLFCCRRWKRYCWMRGGTPCCSKLRINQIYLSTMSTTSRRIGNTSRGRPKLQGFRPQFLSLCAWTRRWDSSITSPLTSIASRLSSGAESPRTSCSRWFWKQTPLIAHRNNSFVSPCRWQDQTADHQPVRAPVHVCGSP